jgi:hypothetical protein
MPVTTPVEGSTVATVGFALDQVPPIAVSVNVAEVPTQMVAAPEIELNTGTGSSKNIDKVVSEVPVAVQLTIDR